MALPRIERCTLKIRRFLPDGQLQPSSCLPQGFTRVVMCQHVMDGDQYNISDVVDSNSLLFFPQEPVLFEVF